MSILKRVCLSCMAAAWLLCLGACQAEQGAGSVSIPKDDIEVFSFTDALGQEIVLEKQPERVAVLLGSFAEIWMNAGGEHTLAAVTQDAFDERGLELGEQVVNLGESHEPSLEALFAAEPDFVILSTDLDGQLALKDALSAAQIPAAWCKVEQFEDYLHLLKNFTDLLGTPERYQQYGLDVQTRVDAAIGSAEGEGPNILLLRAYSGGVKAKNSDNTAGEMLRDLGCHNIADSEEGLLEELQMEAIMTADPEHIFVTTMGSNTEKALKNLEELFLSDPAWQTLTAVREGQIHVLDKSLFHYKPNARWGESYEILADILYPAA